MSPATQSTTNYTPMAHARSRSISLLSEPTRIQISRSLRILLAADNGYARRVLKILIHQEEPINVTNITRIARTLDQSEISQGLKKLLTAKLVMSEKRGKYHYYSVIRSQIIKTNDFTNRLANHRRN